MTLTKLVLAGTAASLGAGLAACGQPVDLGARVAPKAQQITRASFETFGEYIVHFNAQSTTMLPAEVARAFGIRRGANRAMLNIAVLRKDDAGGDSPVDAEVAVYAFNLLGQEKAVSVRELREGEAVYYIGEFAIANEEIVTFNISVRPTGTDAPHDLSFKQQFYRD